MDLGLTMLSPRPQDNNYCGLYVTRCGQGWLTVCLRCDISGWCNRGWWACWCCCWDSCDSLTACNRGWWACWVGGAAPPRPRAGRTPCTATAATATTPTTHPASQASTRWGTVRETVINIHPWSFLVKQKVIRSQRGKLGKFNNTSIVWWTLLRWGKFLYFCFTPKSYFHRGYGFYSHATWLPRSAGWGGSGSRVMRVDTMT